MTKTKNKCEHNPESIKYEITTCKFFCGECNEEFGTAKELELFFQNGGEVKKAKAPKPKKKYEPLDVHTFFGLTYANYAVFRRSMLQSMPTNWQHRFTELIREMDDFFGNPNIPQSCSVSWFGENGKFTKDPVPNYNRGRTRLTRKDFVKKNEK